MPEKTVITEGVVQHINPDNLIKNLAFTNVIVVTGSVKTVYVGGQDAVDASGAIVGKGDIKAQAEQIFNNLQTALAAAEAILEHVIKWNIYVVQGPNPPAVTGVYVAGLANPDFL